jgi:hypothetical protein
MTIRMYCDHCGQEILTETNGGCRLRTGNRELAFHLCGTHQEMLRTQISDFCSKGTTREVSPSLSLKR